MRQGPVRSSSRILRPFALCARFEYPGVLRVLRLLSDVLIAVSLASPTHLRHAPWSSSRRRPPETCLEWHS